MIDGDFQSRFGGIARLYGAAQSQTIARAHVCVVGAGGVGSWAIEALARTGVGEITLIDNDTISLSNVNRQIHTLTETVGVSKVEAMAERVRQINPGCRCHVIDDFLTIATLPEYLAKERGYDYVIDAIDSIKFKSAMVGHCKRNKIPIIMTGGAGGLTDPSMIQIADLSKTYNDPLAAKVRGQLRSEYGFTRNTKRKFGIECVFSSQQQVYPKEDGSVSHEKPGIHGVSLDCRFGYGSATFVTGTFAFFAVSRVLHKILEKAQRLAEKA